MLNKQEIMGNSQKILALDIQYFIISRWSDKPHRLSKQYVVQSFLLVVEHKLNGNSLLLKRLHILFAWC